MANDDFPRILPLPVGGRTIQGQYYLVSTDQDLFIGCPVGFAADGRVQASSGSTVTLGVIGGFIDARLEALASDAPFLDVSAVAAGDDVQAFVYDDPNQEYLIQEDTGGGALALTSVAASADLVYRGATELAVDGNTDSGFANIELDASSLATTTANMFQILRLFNQKQFDGTDNTPGNFAKWVVKLIHPQRGGGTVGTIL